MKIIVAVIASALALLGSGCPPKGGEAQPRYRLSETPSRLFQIEVRGARLITGGKFAVFIVSDPQADVAALSEQAKACHAGQGCGRALTGAELKKFYKDLDAPAWENAVKADRLVAVASEGAVSWTYARSLDVEVVADTILSPASRCFEDGGVQPQCPPQPPVPKDELINVDLSAWRP